MEWYLFNFTKEDGSIYSVMHFCKSFEFAKGYALFQIVVNNYVGVEVKRLTNSTFSEPLFEFTQTGDGKQ